MSSTNPEAGDEEHLQSLSDDDIVTKRKISRRLLFGITGGCFVGAAAILAVSQGWFLPNALTAGDTAKDDTDKRTIKNQGGFADGTDKNNFRNVKGKDK